MPHTIIAAASDAASASGVAVADLGGNAVDAAVAAILTSMTTELGIVSPGAGGYITIWPPDAEPVVIDAYAEMPGRGRTGNIDLDARTISMDYGGGMESIVGWGSVATPGAFKGFELASQKHGKIPWAELFLPTVDLLRNGFQLSQASGYYLTYAHDVIYGWDDETFGDYHRADGSPLAGGDMITNRRLADCFEDLANEGADLLYRGDLGTALARACAERGGLVTIHDLEEYAAVERPPARVGLHHWDIATNAPPAVGGITLSALLTLIETRHIAGWSAHEVARYAAAQDAVFSFRRFELDGVGDRFAGSDSIIEMARRGDLVSIHRSPSTVHASAIDESGLACAITVSAGYGSGAVIPGTGFGLNNSLGEIELISEGLHALPIGQRLLSNMAPTVARSADGASLAIGSPGADRITSAIATVLMNYVVCGMDISDAVDHPRLHAEVFDGKPTLAVEPGVDVSEVSGLEIRELPELSMYFGGVQVAIRTADGSFVGASDPRRTGAIGIGGEHG
jgi:gamma-glutamyltranspeptidase/glutathione hydrolase